MIFITSYIQIFKYFDKTGETLQAGAGGVENLMSSIRERISNLFS